MIDYKNLTIVEKQEIIRNKNFEAMDVLIDDPDPGVRAYVAGLGNDVHRDILVNDPDSYVRQKVAKHGNSDHRDILMWDDDGFVRTEVAIYGDIEQLIFLAGDKYQMIREAAQNRMNEL